MRIADGWLLVHVDRKMAPAVCAERLEPVADLPLIHLPRHVCHWGGFGLVATALEGMRALMPPPCGTARFARSG
jgi:hypothetical protein